MSDNFKNKVQEYCQQRKLALPVYQTNLVKEKLFTSSVSITLNGQTKMGSSLTAHPTKKAAELEAADQLFQKLEIKTESDNPWTKPGYYILDLENIPVSFFPRSDQFFIGFLADTHHSIDKYKDWASVKTPDDFIQTVDNNKLLYLLPAQGLKDMIDHYISSFAHVLYNKTKQNSHPQFNIFIVSRDKAAWCSKLCYQWILPKYEIEVITN